MVSAAVAAPALDEDFFARPVAEVAPALVGCALVVDGVGGVIVETERYQEDDPASHSFRGPRGRARVMFGPPGRLYVYRSYGLHWCANIVCEPAGSGAAVLVRALEPRWGVERMRSRRGAVPDRLLCAGPGRLAQALGLGGAHDGAPLVGHEAVARVLPREGPVEVETGPRIGISKAVEREWRFTMARSRHLSRPRPR
jgi:DNA-3-methyladenine glycosylase